MLYLLSRRGIQKSVCSHHLEDTLTPVLRRRSDCLASKIRRVLLDVGSFLRHSPSYMHSSLLYIHLQMSTFLHPSCRHYSQCCSPRMKRYPKDLARRIRLPRELAGLSCSCLRDETSGDLYSLAQDGSSQPSIKSAHLMKCHSLQGRFQKKSMLWLPSSLLRRQCQSPRRNRRYRQYESSRRRARTTRQSTRSRRGCQST